jgi:hypothetical protein
MPVGQSLPNHRERDSRGQDIGVMLQLVRESLYRAG